jgi:cholesterol transport system auxiliary component
MSARIGLLAALLALSGCNLLGLQHSELNYRGIELRAEPASGAAVTWQLLVDEPDAPDQLSGPRIVYAPGDGSYGVYAGVRWTDRAPVLLQSLLVRGFEDSRRIVGVGRTSSSVAGDFVLLSDLRAFQAEIVGGEPRLRIELSARLLRASSNHAVAARVFAREVPLPGRDVESAIAGFEEALNALVPEIVAWTLSAGEANWASSQPPAR